MADVDRFLDAVDAARIRRVRELSELKRLFSNAVADTFAVGSKAVVVLTYAAWEDFYNECVHVYIDFLSAAELCVADAGWLLLTGALGGDFDALRSRNHSFEARVDFVSRLRDSLRCGFEGFDRGVVLARSNLDFARVRQNLALLDFDASPLQRSRIRLDKELVAWRHGVAHGDAPDLSAMDVSAHVEFPAELMAALSGIFQSAMLRRSGA